MKNCSSLSELNIPATVSEINGSAFEGCTGIKSIEIGKVVGDFSWEDPFSDCSELEKVVILEGTTSISSSAFNDKTKLTSVTLPQSLTNISGFSGCTALTEINLPENLEKIGYEAFMDCTGLKGINFPKNLKEIDNEAFMNCTGLTTININSELDMIGLRSFHGCTGLIELTIPYVETIAEYAFQNCSNLRKVTLPKQLDWLSDGLFNGCTNLAEVNLPPLCEYIGEQTFRNCSSLTEVLIPTSVEEILAEAFAGCTAIKTVKALATTPCKLSNEAFDKKTFANAQLIVPDGSQKAYAEASGWYKFIDSSTFKPASLEMDDSPFSIKQGLTYTLTAKVIDAGSETFEFFYESSDDEIATVSPDGVVKGFEVGRAVITVMALGDQGTALIGRRTLTVEENAGVDTITDTTDRFVEVYTLDGFKCFSGMRSEISTANLAKGMYIIVGENGATKIKL